MFLHAGYEVIVTQVNLLPEVLVPQPDSFAFGYEFCVFHGRFRSAFAGCHLFMDRIYARPVGLGVQTDQGSVAAPAVGIGTIDHVGAYRVEVNIATDLQQVAAAVHQSGFEAALEQVARELVAAVECLGVHAVDVARQARQIGFSGADDQVVVVAHQAVGPSMYCVLVNFKEVWVALQRLERLMPDGTAAVFPGS